MLLLVGSGQIMSVSSRPRPGGTVKLIVLAAVAPSGGIGWLGLGALICSVATVPIWCSGPIHR
jgi:hypothetical protein